jgi:hypothetical protein
MDADALAAKSAKLRESGFVVFADFAARPSGMEVA